MSNIKSTCCYRDLTEKSIAKGSGNKVLDKKMTKLQYFQLSYSCNSSGVLCYPDDPRPHLPKWEDETCLILKCLSLHCGFAYFLSHLRGLKVY